MTGSRALLFVLLLVGAVPGAPATSAHARQQAPRSSFDMRVPLPPTPIIIAGTPYLIYELHLTNFARAPLVVRGVEVLSVESATTLAAWRGAELESRLDRIGGALASVAASGAAASVGAGSGVSAIGTAEAGTHSIAPGQRAVVYFEIALADNVVPRSLEHRISYHAIGEGEEQTATVRGERIEVPTEPPVTLGPPLHGGPWVAIHNAAWERGHRRVLYTVEGRARIPGRFAIDFIKVDAEGRTARGDADQVANWYGYGADVLAVADAVVVEAFDDLPESATLSGYRYDPRDAAAGAYVTLDLGDGSYIFYEHLKPGSIRVKPGERVRRGQTIGALGFTGQSTGPHLHFHVADANSALGAEGLPFVFDRFEVLGAYDDLAQLGKAPWLPLVSSGGGDDGGRDGSGRHGGGPRNGERPAPQSIVVFPALP
jgi:hypothetical protein